ncbi:MAG TPA: hypothetical protein VMY35_17340 [Phycisphaerae bacterium]|nr:hypothetical protein [Thermoguttaceae bacterium]HUX02729.1 hypothetical protein [Phycisphaerae bacterium]
MAEAKERSEWARAAAIVCEIHNCHCTDTIGPGDVHPILDDGPREPDAKMTMHELGEALHQQFPGGLESEA